VSRDELLRFYERKHYKSLAKGSRRRPTPDYWFNAILAKGQQKEGAKVPCENVDCPLNRRLANHRRLYLECLKAYEDSKDRLSREGPIQYVEGGWAESCYMNV